ATGKALAIFDQIENQDILTASKSGVTKFVIDQNGQLGVNTDTPDSILDVVAADPILIVRDTDTSLTTANTRLRLAESGASDALDNYWDLKAEKVGAGDNFSFHIASNGLGEVFSIAASDGDVGIGTTTPTATLDVAGAASVGGQLTFRNVTSAIQTTYNNTLTIGGNTTGNIILSPLNNTGKVGINITPASTVLAFQVGATYTAVASGSTIANVNATMNTDQADNRGFGAQVSFNPTTSLDTIRGSLILPNVNSSNMTVTSFTAVDARVDIAANFSGIVTNGYGFRALNPSDTGAGAFVNYIGLQVSALTVATNSAGISVGNAASTGNNVNLLLGTTTIPTGDFSLYSSSSYDSYFSGNVGFGDTSPSSQVEIGDGTDSIQFSSVGDITFVDANSTASITGPAGGALNITAGAGGVALVLGSDATGDLYYRSSGGILARLAVGTGTQCLVGGTNPAWGSCNASGTDVYWQQTNGALYPSNSTVDLFVGGQASTSAKFAVLDVNGAGAATASVSGNLIVMARNGDGGNVGIGTVNPLNRLTVALGNNQIAQLNDATNASAIWGMNFGIISEASEARLTTAGSLPIVFYTGGTRNSVAEGTERMRIDTSGNLSLATGTSITASSLTTLTTSAAVDWATLTSLTFSADNALISGSDAANGNLSLQGTTNATRTTSYLLLQPNGGNVGIGDSTPSQLFVVGSGDLFQVDSSGNALAPTLALGNGTIARTDRLFDFNDTSSDINTKTYTGSILRTITGTITANRTDYGIYNVVTNNSSDDMFSHTLYGAYNQSTLSSGYTIDVIYGLQGASVISSSQLQPISNLTATLSAGLVGTSNLNAAGTVSSNIGVYALAQNSNASGTVS
ncbi:hypothetical protein HY388_01695, partial [Candidatus Daviesbacteria bacterium]|nr:hypothetical protein [Candidatus Daviesbacteria bacterium]